MANALPGAQLAQEVSCQWLGEFATALQADDAERLATLFETDGYWKDILSFSGAYRTFHGAAKIGALLAGSVGRVEPREWRLAQSRTDPRLTRRSARDVVELFFDFDTRLGTGTGFVRLVEGPNGWSTPRAWILLTTLQNLTGHEERTGDDRPTGVEFSESFAGDNWLEHRQRQLAYADRNPDVLIVGGGQSGLALAARLGQMGVDALIIEKNERVGDNWRNRYHSLTLHNGVDSNHMPYLPFPSTWPNFVPKDKIAGWLESYVEAMELNCWTGAELVQGDYDDATERWNAQVRLHDGTIRTFSVPHLVLAVGGASSTPHLPHIPGMDSFKGDVFHSSAFTQGTSYVGKRAVVFGTGNSGHDVAQELYANGAASVTMVQRNPTTVVSLVPSGTLVYSLYSEGPPADDIDLITAAIPYPVLRDTYQWLSKRMAKLDEDLLARLNAVGFKTDFGADNTGFHMKYLRQGGGYYINVGASDLIADRKIGLVQADDIETMSPMGLRMRDGSELPADLVVLATGYCDLEHTIEGLLGPTVAQAVGPVWGFDERFNMRNMWQETAQPGFWIMGGAFMECRLHSRFLALQILAKLKHIELGGLVDSDPVPERNAHLTSHAG